MVMKSIAFVMSLAAALSCFGQEIPKVGPRGDGAFVVPTEQLVHPPGQSVVYPDRLLVCLSMNNTLAIVNLTDGRVEKEIDVGIAPYAVLLSADRKVAYVTNWGGRRATEKDKTAKSAGDDVVVDEHGTAASGTVS